MRVKLGIIVSKIELQEPDYVIQTTCNQLLPRTASLWSYDHYKPLHTF